MKNRHFTVLKDNAGDLVLHFQTAGGLVRQINKRIVQTEAAEPEK